MLHTKHYIKRQIFRVSYQDSILFMHFCSSPNLLFPFIRLILFSRDPKSVNSHVYLPWDRVVTEPVSYRQLFCKCSLWFGLCSFVIRPPWNVSRDIFLKTSQSLYTKLSLPFMLFISLWCGFSFAILAFTQIWIIQPFKKILQLNGIMLRKFTAQCFGECSASVTHIWRTVFSGNYLNINTVNTELAGVFLTKKHGSLPIDGSFKPGKIVDKSKERYPKILKPSLPFMSRVTKAVSKKMMFMKQALQIAQSKLPSFEIMESAFRLAVVKRQEKKDDIIQQSLNLAKSRRGGVGANPVEGDNQHHGFYIEDRQAPALWGLAKRLAMARAKRGKTNWMKARQRISERKKPRKTSFWFQAKNLVFSDQHPPDKKILKIL